MNDVTYLFDTNAVTDLMRAEKTMVTHVVANRQDKIFGLPQPVDYEIMRGLLWKSAPRQQKQYQEIIKPQFRWIEFV